MTAPAPSQLCLVGYSCAHCHREFCWHCDRPLVAADGVELEIKTIGSRYCGHDACVQAEATASGLELATSLECRDRRRRLRNSRPPLGGCREYTANASLSRSVAFRPERVFVTPAVPPAPDWIVHDITFVNKVVPPWTEEDRLRQEGRAKRHDPEIARTLIGGPGNRSRIVSCACRDPHVNDEESWAVHVGVPGGGVFLRNHLALQDVAQDVLNYPSDETRANLRRVIGNVGLKP